MVRAKAAEAMPMQQLTDRLSGRLQERKLAGNLRSLKLIPGVDFASNDYLGLGHSEELRERILARLKEEAPSNGATGSRLLTGNSRLAEELEAMIARLFNSEAALLFNSGYTLNTGLPGFLSEPGDIILMDELAHASLKAGLKLSDATGYFFRHNDLLHLRQKLQRLEPDCKGQIFIVVESVYSMDGDLAPLRELVDLAEDFRAHLIVDEAHAMGILDHQGRGLVSALGLEDRVLARVVTFGKAFGSHGAALLGSELLCRAAVNFCGSFIYTTAASGHQLVALRESLIYWEENPDLIGRLRENIGTMNQLLGFLRHESPIYSFPFTGLKALSEAATQLQKEGFCLFPVCSPTVRRGTERLRVVLHSFNTKSSISGLCEALRKYESYWQKNFLHRH